MADRKLYTLEMTLPNRVLVFRRGELVGYITANHTRALRNSTLPLPRYIVNEAREALGANDVELARGVTMSGHPCKVDVKPESSIALKDRIRTAVAEYVWSEGCSCCEREEHKEHKRALAELLGVEQYEDGSGYNFSKYLTPESREKYYGKNN